MEPQGRSKIKWPRELDRQGTYGERMMAEGPSQVARGDPPANAEDTCMTASL